MKLKDIGERALIERLRERTRRGKGVCLGIGDDTAVIANGPLQYLLFTTDMLVEGVHFRTGERDARAIGQKALAVSVSDIAAMGGTPREAVVSLGAPARTGVRFLEGIYGGIQGLARRTGVTLVGGDTVRSRNLVINIALLGEVARKDLVTRSGAKPGDELWVTGRLGGNREGKSLRTTPRLKAASKLVRRFRPHAMIDISDGLWTDLGNLCRASHVGARIHLERLPVHPLAKREGRRKGIDPRRLALAGGEDFELLAAIPMSRAKGLTAARVGLPIRRIGEVIKGNGSFKVYDRGRIAKVKKNLVWKHF